APVRRGTAWAPGCLWSGPSPSGRTPPGRPWPVAVRVASSSNPHYMEIYRAADVVARRFDEWLRHSGVVHNRCMSGFRTAILLGALSALFLLIGQLIGGETGLVIAFIFALVTNIGSYWFSDKIVLRMYKAKPVAVDHPLYKMTERLAVRARLPMPRVY